MGSFRPGAGNQHLHWYFNFTGCIVETVPNHYVVRVGTYPDKEFRYLRTVIVDGRRLLGLKFKASTYAQLSFNLPALAGVSPYTSPTVSQADLCFYKQLLWATPFILHFVGTPYPEVTWGHFAEFLINASSVGLRILLLIHLCRFTVRVQCVHNSAFPTASSPASLL